MTDTLRVALLKRAATAAHIAFRELQESFGSESGGHSGFFNDCPAPVCAEYRAALQRDADAPQFDWRNIRDRDFIRWFLTKPVERRQAFLREHLPFLTALSGDADAPVGPECVCESEFVWACGPECTCYHHAVRDAVVGRETPEQRRALADAPVGGLRDEHCAGCGNALHHECEHTELGCQRCMCSTFVPWAAATSSADAGTEQEGGAG